MKITAAQIPRVRDFILIKQEHTCPLCQHPMKQHGTKKTPCLDHSHKTGYIRGVLCVACNGAEGRIMKRAAVAAGAGADSLEWLSRMVAYLEAHRAPQWGTRGRKGLIHPTHKTENDKRLDRLAKAKKVRAAAKAKKG